MSGLCFISGFSRSEAGQGVPRFYRLPDAQQTMKVITLTSKAKTPHYGNFQGLENSIPRNCSKRES
jgi:hypothetical protein